MVSRLLLGSYLVAVVALACGPSASENETGIDTGASVPRSEVGSAFAELLSSGLSVADVTERALPSVAHVAAGSGAGTGFVIDKDGLVVTNKHVVGSNNEVSVEFVSGDTYRGNVTYRHPSLDLAYIQLNTSDSFQPIAIGDSDQIRVGEEVIAIGFPLSKSLGLEPTVSVGIVSSKRNGHLQTDAALNPGNSGGPLLDTHGNVAGIITSRLETDDSGRPIAGIGFAIPINTVKASMTSYASRAGSASSTQAPTPFPAIGPTPDLAATKAAIDAIDAYRRQSDLATRAAREAKEEAERYAASLEATRIAELPTPTPRPTPTPEPTPTPLPTPTPHPATFCQEWEALVLEWIKQGRIYKQGNTVDPYVPDHPQLSAKEADRHCLTRFPLGVLPESRILGDVVPGARISIKVGNGPEELLPGTYQYVQQSGDKRVEAEDCLLILNSVIAGNPVDMPYGEPFTFTFLTYHEDVSFHGFKCSGHFYRIGD